MSDAAAMRETISLLIQAQILISIPSVENDSFLTLTLSLSLLLRPLILTIRIRVRLARIVRLTFRIAIIIAGIYNFRGGRARAFGGSAEACDARGFEGVHLTC